MPVGIEIIVRGSGTIIFFTRVNFWVIPYVHGNCIICMFCFAFSRFPSVFSTLEPDFVAKEVVAGTLRNEESIILPRTSAVFFLMNA